MPLLKSVYSDPIAAGVDTGVKVLTALDQLETSKQRRELMAQETAEHKLRVEHTQTQMDEEKKKAGYKQQLRDKFGGMSEDEITNFVTGIEESKKENPKWTDEQIQANISGALTSHMISNDPGKWAPQAKAADTVVNFMNTAGQKMQGKKVLDAASYPDLFGAVEELYDHEYNKGTDKYGNSTDTGVVTKALYAAYLDSSTKPPSIAFSLGVKYPGNPDSVLKHIGSSTPKFTAGDVNKYKGMAPGMSVQGNIDLSKRPVVINGDGASISTLMSKGFTFEEGEKEVHVLLPTISPEGKRWTDDEAVEAYKKTGKHLGKFDSQGTSDSYAQTLHSDPMWDEDIKVYIKERGYKGAPMTLGRDADPNKPVVQIPAPLLHAQVLETQKFLGTLLKMQAMSDPEKFAEKHIAAQQTKRENQTIKQIFSSIDSSKSILEQRKEAIAKMPENMPLEKFIKAFEAFKGTGTITQYQDEILKLKKNADKRAEAKAERDEDKDSSPTRIKEFEIESGFGPKDRGTPEYRAKFRQFRKEDKQDVTTPKETKPLSSSVTNNIKRSVARVMRPRLNYSEKDTKDDEIYQKLETEDKQKYEEIVDKVTEMIQKNPKLTPDQATHKVKEELGGVKENLKTFPIEKSETSDKLEKSLKEKAQKQGKQYNRAFIKEWAKKNGYDTTELEKLWAKKDGEGNKQ